MVQLVLPARQLHPHSSPDSPSPHDWILIELQGALAPDGQETLAGLELGRMEIAENGIPYLYIANHKLEGKRVPIPKPLALIQKLPAPTPQSSKGNSSSMQVDGPLSQADSEKHSTNSDANITSKPSERSLPTYEAVTIVKYKYIFKARPDYVLEEKLRGLTEFY
ncbi:hypothetical protein DFS34DRAFT_600852 [Phlyctochytrium arcticum]|nr:hypothetical protein DFS34DRAFT_600852 [Phlyctochytrium arcticum]